MIGKLAEVPRTDPSNLLRLRDGVYAGDLFVTAVAYLDFFSWLDNNAGDADLRGICSSLQIEERPADVMLTLFKSLNLIVEGDGGYCLTELSRDHLAGSSPWFLGPYISSLKGMSVCGEMLEVLKTGKPANWGAGKGGVEWSLAMEDVGFAEVFTVGMDSRGAYFAPVLARAIDLSGHDNLLDVAGASGIYSSAIVSQYPHLLASVFEKPPVDRIARNSIDKWGLSDRIGVVTGDMFRDEFPSGFDVHLFSNVLHDWDVGAVKLLLENSYRNLRPGGRILIHDAHLNAEKDGPLTVAEYSVLLMFLTEGRCYSISEMEEVLVGVGFSEIACVPTVASRSVIMGKKPV
ncbi:MAG: methyltransferase [Methanosarcinales archaeon]|nr:MAG: methyltransferase [Methanosarcinales archaeon]